MRAPGARPAQTHDWRTMAEKMQQPVRFPTQEQPAPRTKAALFRAYQQWIRSFLDDEGEVNRAAANFMVALQNQPSKFQKMDAAA